MDPKASPTRVRHAVVWVTALMSVLLYLDRFCISIAEIYIKEALTLTDIQIGWILSAFFWTYALGQVPAGWLTDRFGARIMLSLYILLWSLFTGMMGLATGFVMLMLFRFGFGFAQAGAYPSAGSLISKWVPFSGRGMASSIVALGGRAGGAVAPLLTAFVILAFVPLSHPSQFEPDDILNIPRLCYEMRFGSETKGTTRDEGQNNTAALVGKRLRKSLPEESRQVVDSIAEKLALVMEADRKQKEKQRDSVKPSKKATKVKTVGLDLDLPIDALDGRQASDLVRDLNVLLDDPNWYHEEDFKEVKFPHEAKKLLKEDAASLSPAELQRRNRLLLEAAFPESLRKVYGEGWRKMMFSYGLLGLAVAMIFWIVLRNSPGEHPKCNQAERDLIAHGSPQQVDHTKRHTGGVPIKGLVSSPSMWLNCASQWFTNVGWIFLVTWLPRYLQEVHKVPIEDRALMASLPMGIGWIGLVIGGWLTDRLVPLVGLRWGRALPLSISRFIAMGAYIVCLFEPAPWVAVSAFIVVSIATNLGTPAIWAYVQDVGGRQVGSVLGWGNMWGNLGAAVAPLFLIWIVVSGDQRNWNAALLTCAIAFLLSGIASIGIDATKPVVDD